MAADRILPTKEDRDTGGFFEAADRGELVYRACNACGQTINPPRARCAICGSWDTAWKTSNGKGRLHSWTTVTHQVHPKFPVPYTVFVVELDDAPDVHLVGYMDGTPLVEAGMPMRVRFDPTDDGGALPQWEPDPSDPSERDQHA